jgi:tetratricopeptide (TPR) repeat protein
MIGTLVVLALIVGFCAGWYFIVFLSRPRQQQHAAEVALEQRRYDDALNHLRLCASEWPNDARVQLLLARTERLRGEVEQAEKHLLSCQRLQEKQSGRFGDDAKLEWALLEAQRGNLGKVEPFLRSRLQANDPDSVLILDTLSTELVKSNRLPEAKQCLDTWVQLQPNNGTVLMRRGSVLEHLRSYDEALTDYRHSLDADPEQDQVRLHVAALLLDRNRTSEAAEHAQLLAERLPENPRVLALLARMRCAEGKLEEADKLLERSLAKNAQDPQTLSQRGALFLQLGRPPEEAEKLFRRALERAPYERQTLYLLSSCLERLGKKDEAKQLAARLARNDAEMKRLESLTHEITTTKPDDVGLRYEVGRILLSNGFTDDGLRWLGTVLKRDPGHEPTRRLLADFYRGSGQGQVASRDQFSRE